MFLWPISHHTLEQKLPVAKDFWGTINWKIYFDPRTALGAENAVIQQNVLLSKFIVTHAWVTYILCTCHIFCSTQQ